MFLYWGLQYIDVSTEINKGWKLEVDIDDVKFGTGGAW